MAFRDIATAIGRGLGVPAVSLDEAEAAAHFGWFAHFAALGNRASGTATRETLGWEPTGPGLLDDIANAGYFNWLTRRYLHPLGRRICSGFRTGLDGGAGRARRTEFAAA